MQHQTQTKTATKTKATKTAKAKPDAKAIEAAKAAKAAERQAEREALQARIGEQRKTAASVFARLSNAASVPVKPRIKFAYAANVSPHANARKPSVRQAAAIAVALTASGKSLRNGTTFPRNFDMHGNTYAIENGALSDALRSGLVTYDTDNETITIANATEIQAQLGKALAGFKL